ncbi:MAG: hypothetical protein M1839_003496 [Geoglossum umbratile]|nr:MAG: hypothetical protein M1839_003496 [Geoglossum umbratile]
MEVQEIEAAIRRIRNGSTQLREILGNQGTPQASFWVQAGRQVIYKDTVAIGATPLEGQDPGTTIYGIGSMSKIMLACALCILISESRESSHPIHLEDPIANHIDKLSLPDSVTIMSLLLHMSGLPSLTDLILGPDGHVWATRERLLSVVNSTPEYGEVGSSGDAKLRVEYSNSGYILAGFLIDRFSSQGSVGLFLKERLFEPLGMDSTITHCAASHSGIAAPHVVTADRASMPIPHKNYSEDTVAFSAMGIYSCTKDLAIFFEALLSAYANGSQEPRSPLSADVAQTVLGPYIASYHNGDSKGDVGYGLGVCHTTSLQSSAVGMFSLNRIVSPGLCGIDGFRLRGGLGNSQEEIFCHGGAITGYESVFYLMPKTRSFIVVLTNATGLGDASDFISRLLLQNLFDLELERSILEISNLCADERLRWILSHHVSSVANIPLDTTIADITGSYINKDFGQSISIYEKGGLLLATLSSTDFVHHSEDNPVELGVLSSEPQTICLCTRSHEDFARLGIDIYASWGLEFIIKRQASRVVSLERKRAKHSLIYSRSQEDKE